MGHRVKANDNNDYLRAARALGLDEGVVKERVQKQFSLKERFVQWNPEANEFHSNQVSFFNEDTLNKKLDVCWREALLSCVAPEGKNKFIGQTIKALRKSKNYTQETLAKKACVYPRLIQKIERGEIDPRNVPHSNILRIALALGLNCSDDLYELPTEKINKGKENVKEWTQENLLRRKKSMNSSSTFWR